MKMKIIKAFFLGGRQEEKERQERKMVGGRERLG